MSNPYQTPRTTSSEPEIVVHRALRWQVIVLCQAALYGLLAFVGFTFGTFVILLGGAAGARPEELVLALVAAAVSPLAGWLCVSEVVCARRVVPGREAWLAMFSMILTLAPLTMSAFWAWEFFAFGSFQLNAVPAILSLFFSCVWGGLSIIRHRRARTARQMSLEDPA